MRRWITISIVVFSIILASTVQADGLFQKLYFVGLWQGIDTVDGSEAQRSITLNRDGTFNINGFESYLSACLGGRGTIAGTGVLQDGKIISDDLEVTCEEWEVGVLIPQEYIPDKLNGTLMERSTNDPYGIPRTTLHKISNR